MTKYDLLKQSLGSKAVVFSCIRALENDQYLYKKYLSDIWEPDLLKEYKSNIKHLTRIIKDLETVAISSSERGE